MSIWFEKNDKELLLCYAPDRKETLDYVKHQIATNSDINIKKVFLVNSALMCSNDEEDYEETFRFTIGKKDGNYYKMNSDVLHTKHTFYFFSKINITEKMFVASRNISILRKIDEMIERDCYIGGEWEKNGGLALETFRVLIERFPKSAELDKYAHSRIASVLKDSFPEMDKYEKVFEEFIASKDKLFTKYCENESENYYARIELAQFTIAFDTLKEMLLRADSISEPQWQEQIHKILKLLYTKYIFCTRELMFKGVDGYDKKPDFILVDANGFIDVLEIKKASLPILTKQASYRHNYVPVREFSGMVQQLEKYIYCLNSLGDKDPFFDKLTDRLSNKVTPQVVNPQGILLIGRSNEFNEQQKRDFELIKRRYKNVADIMTYDDLLSRLQNIIDALKQQI